MFFRKKIPIHCKNCDKYICPYCGGIMTKKGFEGHNERYECENCERIIESTNF